MHQQISAPGAGSASTRVEHRVERRRRVLKAGLIFFNDGFSSYDCLIRNQTSDGFRADLENPHLIPDEVMFSFDGEAAVPAYVVWRSTTSLGIQLADN